MRVFVRFLVVAVLVWAMLVLFRMARDAQAVGGDPSTVIVCFGGVILVGALGAAVLAFMVLPALGDFLTGLFSSDQHPHAAARAKAAAGDYQGAIDEYRLVLNNNPMDMHAVRAIADLYIDKLDDYEGGVEYLRDAIQTGHWTDIQRQLLRDRLNELTA